MKKDTSITPEQFLMAPMTAVNKVQWDDVGYYSTIEAALQEGADSIGESENGTVHIYKLIKILQMEVKITDVK